LCELRPISGSGSSRTERAEDGRGAVITEPAVVQYDMFLTDGSNPNVYWPHVDHEDQGMTQNVKIGVPDGHGGMAMPHDTH
jgi:hypothetical protein